MGGPPESDLAPKVWFVLVAAVVDGGEPGDEGALLLLFQVLGHGGNVSLVVLLGVVLTLLRTTWLCNKQKVVTKWSLLSVAATGTCSC